jgi:hypothetical protein
MASPIHLTRSRLAIAMLLGLAPSASWSAAAAAADWNCARGEDGKDWVCTSTKRAKGAEPAAAPKAVEPSAPRATAKPAEPTEPARPQAPETVETPVQARRPPAAPPRREPPPQAESPSQEQEPDYTGELDQPYPAEASEEPGTPAAQAPRQPKPPRRAEAPSKPAASQRAEAQQPPAPAATQPQRPPSAAPEPPPKRIPEALRPEAAKAASAEEATGKPRPPGWTCSPAKSQDSSEKGWDCSLEGPDPRGMAHVVDNDGEPSENWAESTTITREDEQRFQKISTLLPADPWKNVCAGRPQ